jgi:hypothetical protein
LADAVKYDQGKEGVERTGDGEEEASGNAHVTVQYITVQCASFFLHIYVDQTAKRNDADAHTLFLAEQVCIYTHTHT